RPGADLDAAGGTGEDLEVARGRSTVPAPHVQQSSRAWLAGGELARDAEQRLVDFGQHTRAQAAHARSWDTGSGGATGTAARFGPFVAAGTAGLVPLSISRETCSTRSTLASQPRERGSLGARREGWGIVGPRAEIHAPSGRGPIRPVPARPITSRPI